MNCVPPLVDVFPRCAGKDHQFFPFRNPPAGRADKDDQSAAQSIVEPEEMDEMILLLPSSLLSHFSSSNIVILAFSAFAPPFVGANSNLNDEQNNETPKNGGVTAPPNLNGTLRCYYCRHTHRVHEDLSDPLIQRAECQSFELFDNHSLFQRPCAQKEAFCMTSVSTLNGFFVEMRRDCAERCRPGCQESGYGLFSQQCVRCCRTPLCNHFDGRKFLLNDPSVQQVYSGTLLKDRKDVIEASLSGEDEQHQPRDNLA